MENENKNNMKKGLKIAKKVLNDNISMDKVSQIADTHIKKLIMLNR